MARNDNFEKQDNIVGYIAIALTESGEVIVDNDSIMDVGLRIQLLSAALELENQIQEDMLAKTPEGYYYS